MAALEQEIASVIRFILDSVPGITPYYWDIPEGFVVPSVFFPQPELTPLGDTFASYAVEYDWYIKFFASTDEDAYASAAAALNAICAARLLVPLIDEAGAAVGGGVRLKDPGGVKRLDTGMAEKNASAAQTAQKFPIERLAKACRTLFHVSASTFAGATAGMTGEYTVEEMRKHIDEWLGKEAVV